MDISWSKKKYIKNFPNVELYGYAKFYLFNRQVLLLGLRIYFMTYWKIQLHPNDNTRAVEHTMRTLGLRYIGLGFANQPGDFTGVSADEVVQSQRDYWEFSHTMHEGDLVLVVAHHYPCALVQVLGCYNYVHNPEEEIGVWFRHFRRVKVVGYYADFVVNPAQWKRTKMTDAIVILRNTESLSYQLIEEWRTKLGI